MVTGPRRATTSKAQPGNNVRQETCSQPYGRRMATPPQATSPAEAVAGDEETTAEGNKEAQWEAAAEAQWVSWRRTGRPFKSHRRISCRFETETEAWGSRSQRRFQETKEMGCSSGEPPRRRSTTDDKEISVARERQVVLTGGEVRRTRRQSACQERGCHAQPNGCKAKQSE